MTRAAIPTVRTDRLVLRAPQPKDFEAFAEFRAGPRMTHLGGPFDRTQAFIQFCALYGHWDMRGYGRWIAADKNTDAALGVVGLFFPEDWPERELAWSLFEGAEGKGYATEAALAARDHAFQTLGWDRLVSYIAVENARSIALAERLGAVQESGFDHPTYGPLLCYAHVPSDTRANARPAARAGGTAP